VLLRWAALACALLLGSCAGNPTGGANFVLMSEKSELETGRTEHEKLLLSTQIYHDAKLQALVEKVGQRLAAISHRPELHYHFTIIDSTDINAFALPGGYIYVNRGLLDVLTSESQLAAVMGHEIGHVTARHAVRQNTAQTTSRILSTAAVLATGVSSLGNTADLFGGALISGYGREMELEADGLGAEYLAKAGYDPNAMVEVITALKNQEDFNRKNAKKAPAYHGLFATHPSNDTRLHDAIAQSNTLKTRTPVAVNPQDFRIATTGLLVGPSVQNLAGNQGRNRYYQPLLNYTLVLPEAWLQQATTTTLTATAPAGSHGTLKVEAQRLQQSLTPPQFIHDVLKIADLAQGEALQQYGLEGYTGINAATGERIAVLYHEGRAYSISASGPTDAVNAALLDSIKSLRPTTAKEAAYADPLHISWIQADGRSTYTDLARQSRLPEFPEAMLRLMNGDYPAGQPKAGQWIKLVK
jgi:hypothetical protein